MTEQTTAVQQRPERNAMTGAGYPTGPAGRIMRLRDYMQHPNVESTIRNVLPTNSEKYVQSVLNEIRKSVADDKKDLSVCTPESLVSTIVDAANMGLAIDGRQHAHIVKRKETATLQIGYRGYLHRLGSHLNGFLPVVQCVYAGDTFTCGRDGDQAVYTHQTGNPFEKQGRLDRDIVGAYAYLSWVGPDGRRMSTLETIDLAQINKIKAAAQTKAIWDGWYTEKIKVAVIRRACKMAFSSITSDLDQQDNEDFDLETVNRAPTSEHTNQLGDRIGAGMASLDAPPAAPTVVAVDEGKPGGDHTVEVVAESQDDGSLHVVSMEQRPAAAERFDPETGEELPPMEDADFFNDPDFLNDVHQREMEEAARG